MPASTDTGSVIARARSGAHWGYRRRLRLLIAQLLLITQELAARAGGMGFADLTLERLVRAPAALAPSALWVSCFRARGTQFCGVERVDALFGLLFRLGSFELVVLVVAWRLHPETQALVA